MNTKTEKIVGAGLGVAAVAALGTYLMYGKRGEKNRKQIAGWMLKMKGEVLEKVEQARDITREEYDRIVDEVSARYEKLGEAGAEELKHITGELKDAWQHLSAQLKRPAQRARRKEAEPAPRVSVPAGADEPKPGPRQPGF